MINNVNIQGNLVKDGTFKNSGSGSMSYFNTIAVNSINSKGERERYFFPIRAHGKVAVYMANTTHKGNEITILGTLTQNPLNKEINILVNKYSNHDLNRVKISKYNQGNGYNQNNNDSYNNQGNGYNQNNNNPYNQGNGYNQNNNNPYNQGNGYNQNNNNSYNNQGNGYNQNNNDSYNNQGNGYNQNNSLYNQDNNSYNQNNNHSDPYNWDGYDEPKNNQNSTNIDDNDFSGLYV
ncbi:TPA: single-stranded DNA-binding protein [Clostridioides difficile]|nr:single-stranded DNA-binding protein [Clostridioides difficile]